jgi:formate--tetrahydrofolate ligase
MQKIVEIAEKLSIPRNALEMQGDFIAKVDPGKIIPSEKIGKLILVTAITPTKFGEGKTTMSIGLADALSLLNKKTALCLREPSLGPVFSQKGGAAGGGKATVEPSDGINLHFTGDFHAITTVHNLIAAEIDNSIYWGNPLNIRTVLWKRAIDLCDRSLREEFNITASSEIMAVFCLADSEDDLKKRLEQVVIGINRDSLPVKVQDLGISDNLIQLLKRAFKPNLVQTAEGTPAFVHGGPFANIAHGTNSLAATKLALKIADYAVTEAGFGSDLGAFKFFDIISRQHGIYPDAVVLVATARAIKINGLENLSAHIKIIKTLGCKPVVAINAFLEDEMKDLAAIHDFCQNENIPCAMSEAYSNGGKGSLELAREVLKVLEQENARVKTIYGSDEKISEKITKVNRLIFGGGNEEIYETALEKIRLFESWGYGNLPICIAKTQYSISDDKEKTGSPKDFTLHATDASLSLGAGFIVIYCGNVLTMPGMPKKNG